MLNKKLYVADFFAGCGGLSLGLELAGFHPAYVNELNKDAIESYLLNREQDNPHLRNEALDFPRFSRQLIMSEITKRKLNERHQIYRRV